MSDQSVFWLRVVAVTAVSLAIVTALAPPLEARVSWPAAVVLGACAGIGLFSGVTRSRPRLPRAANTTPVAVAKLLFLGLWAANEEVLWRRLALGGLLDFGVVSALCLSTLGFALLHRSRLATHLFTGGMFGALYVSTGVLAAPIAAHWTYNALVSGLVARRLPTAEAAA